jgi:hypothetical protein
VGAEDRRIYPSDFLQEDPWRNSNALGANFMSGKDILFAVENFRLGFAESDCDFHLSWIIQVFFNICAINDTQYSYEFMVARSVSRRCPDPALSNGL